MIKSRHRRTLVGAATVITLLLIALGAYHFGLADKPKPSAADLWNQTAHDGAHTVTINLGDVVLAVPDNYLRVPPAHQELRRAIVDDPDRIDASLLVLLPGFEPRTKTNEAAFTDGTVGQKLLIHIAYKYLKASRWKANEHSLDIAVERQVMADPASGMNFYKLQPNVDVLFTGALDKAKDRVECEDDSMRQGPKSREPACVRSISIGEDITINLQFSRAFLPRMNDIERGTIDLLDHFRTRGNALSITE